MVPRMMLLPLLLECWTNKIKGVYPWCGHVTTLPMIIIVTISALFASEHSKRRAHVGKASIKVMCFLAFLFPPLMPGTVKTVAEYKFLDLLSLLSPGGKRDSTRRCCFMAIGKALGLELGKRGFGALLFMSVGKKSKLIRHGRNKKTGNTIERLEEWKRTHENDTSSKSSGKLCGLECVAHTHK